jgi:prolyl-tRNA synthetase
MRVSDLLLPTVKEDPAGAEAVSHRLMIRAGLIRQLGAGIYVYLPAGWRVMQKIREIIRQEMDAIGCQELLMPVINPADIWQESGRWSEIGDELFRFKDRKGSDMALAMTHEEVITWLAAREVHSYKQLPQLWYHIQTKERDEARPKSGVLRTREFIMKDSYSLDRDVEGLQTSYQKHIAAYDRIFARCDLDAMMVEGDSGIMGGEISHEYMAFSDAGEDEIVFCESCGYAANLELAVSGVAATETAAASPPADRSGSGEEATSGAAAGSPPVTDPAAAGRAGELREVHTPGARTIEQVSAFLGVDAAQLIKALIVISDDRGPLMVLVRGDHDVLEAKLRRIVGEFHLASADEVLEVQGAEAGFVGPVGTTVPILADEVLRSGSYVSGANKRDYHLVDVTAGDFTAEFHDLRAARAADPCRDCGAPLRCERVIEVGNIFQLGTKYSAPMGATYLDEHGSAHDIVMGSYGIGLARIAAAAVEQHHDGNGIAWPPAIAPYLVHLVVVKASDATQVELAESLYDDLLAAGADVIFDDRDLSPGIKFKDADLLGCPLQVIVGRGAASGLVEVKQRATGERAEVSPAESVERARALVARVAADTPALDRRGATPGAATS